MSDRLWAPKKIKLLAGRVLLPLCRTDSATACVYECLTETVDNGSGGGARRGEPAK